MGTEQMRSHLATARGPWRALLPVVIHHSNDTEAGIRPHRQEKTQREVPFVTTANNPKATPKSFSQTTGANVGSLQGEWVKKQDILGMPLIVYKTAVYDSRFKKGSKTATFQIRLEADVTELEDDAPYYQFSSDSARMVNIAEVVSGDDLPFRAALA